MENFSDVVIIDTREKPRAISKIEKYFDDNGIRHISSKMYCGDYQLLSNGKKVVDRKQSLSEVCSNLTQQHERFRSEAERAIDAGIELVVLVEHGGNIRCIDDVKRWINPRRFAYCRKHGISTRGNIEMNIAEFMSHGGQRQPTTGEQLYKTMLTMTRKYKIRWDFCRKEDTGRRIIEILTE